MTPIKEDLTSSMIIAAFTGIAWYIGLEINLSLFLLFKRRRGLYFWSCALTSWGVILQPLFIILGDFGVWKAPVPSVTLIYLTWFIMVIPQSWVLYSRLHLLLDRRGWQKIIKYVLIFNSICFSIPTIVLGTISQTTSLGEHLSSSNLVWDRVQLVVFFVQETALSILYIFQTRGFLRRRAPLRQRHYSPTQLSNTMSNDDRQHREERDVLWQLLFANAFIIALDIALLGIQCADLFYIQGAFKPCVYGVKLKLEFVILNRLISIVRRPTQGAYFNMGSGDAERVDSHAAHPAHGNSLWSKHSNEPRVEGAGSSDNTLELDQVGSEARIRRFGNHTMVSSNSP